MGDTKICEDCGKEIDLETCDLEADDTPICNHCSTWHPDRVYSAGYAYACGYRD